MIATQANLTHSHTPVQLIISTDALVLKRSDDSQIICSHRMEGISFASAGEHVCSYIFFAFFIFITKFIELNYCFY
jgi:hypothetical protein